MALSITENNPDLKQSPPCKRSLQVGRDYETICDASRVSAYIAKALALSEYEIFNTAILENEAGLPNVDFE